MRFVQGLEMYRKLAEPVAGPNQLGSLLQLAKKARVTDDAARRLLDQLAAELNHPLIVAQDRRITLTDAGRQLLEVAVRLTAIADGGETPPDVLNVEIAPALAECLLPLALPEFFSLFATLVQLRFYPLNTDLVRNNIQSRATTFGAGFADYADTVSASETLGPKFRWIMLVAPGHRLASPEPINGENLTVNDRIFLPEMARKWPGMDNFLRAVPQYNQIECDGTVGVRLASGLGAAVVPDMLADNQLLYKRVIQEVQPGQPRLFLPRNGVDGLTEAEQALVECIRKAAEAWCKQESPKAKADEEEVFEALVEETVTPMEEVLS